MQQHVLLLISLKGHKSIYSSDLCTGFLELLVSGSKLWLLPMEWSTQQHLPSLNSSSRCTVLSLQNRTLPQIPMQLNPLKNKQKMNPILHLCFIKRQWKSSFFCCYTCFAALTMAHLKCIWVCDCVIVCVLNTLPRMSGRWVPICGFPSEPLEMATEASNYPWPSGSPALCLPLQAPVACSGLLSAYALPLCYVLPPCSK